MINKNSRLKPLNANSKKTMTIDPRCKEMYCNPSLEIKESTTAIQNRHIFWNNMMYLSMQNTIIQMAK